MHGNPESTGPLEPEPPAYHACILKPPEKVVLREYCRGMEMDMEDINVFRAQG